MVNRHFFIKEFQSSSKFKWTDLKKAQKQKQKHKKKPKQENHPLRKGAWWVFFKCYNLKRFHIQARNFVCNHNLYFAAHDAFRLLRIQRKTFLFYSCIIVHCVVVLLWRHNQGVHKAEKFGGDQKRR